MDHFSPLTDNLLLALLILVLGALCLVAVLVLIRKRRQAKKACILPLHNTDENDHKRLSHRRRPALIISSSSFDRQSKFAFVQQAKDDLVKNSDSPPTSPIPEIRITFPEEFSEDGKRQSGRVVVVRVGENGIGLEPVEENLPTYQQIHADTLQSLDLERMGGLKD